mmetsp:Transcript_137609/g.252408  ORF Transcript_137609/g.252408 Transcript_137609/m.252408 type:complete len:219 (-) Transcript_137609:52-708(-)
MVKRSGGLRQPPGTGAVAKRRLTAIRKATIKDVTVRTSLLPGAGQGLFATRDLEAHTLLPEPYKGKKLLQAQFERVRDFSYCMILPHRGKSVSKFVAIDSKACRSGNPLRYVNGAKTREQAKNVNVRMVCRNGEVYFETTRPVRNGKEFLVDYGPNYWEGLEHNTRLAALQKAIRTARAKLAAATTAASQQRGRQELQAARDRLEDFVEDDSEDESDA